MFRQVIEVDKAAAQEVSTKVAKEEAEAPESNRRFWIQSAGLG